MDFHWGQYYHFFIFFILNKYLKVSVASLSLSLFTLLLSLVIFNLPSLQCTRLDFLSFYYHGLSSIYIHIQPAVSSMYKVEIIHFYFKFHFFYFHSFFACLNIHFFFSLLTHLFSLDIFNVQGGIFVLIFQWFNLSISLFCCCPRSIILPWPFTVSVFIFNLPSL